MYAQLIVVSTELLDASHNVTYVLVHASTPDRELLPPATSADPRSDRARSL